MSSPRILVTGATGLLGSHALRELRGGDRDVVGTWHRQTTEEIDQDVAMQQLDLASPGAADELGALDPDVIVHCAVALPGSFHGDSAERVAAINRRIDDAVIDYSRRAGCRLVYLSGTSVYGLNLEGVTDESGALHPEGPYVEGKAESEGRIAESLEDYAVLRVSAPYGAGQRARTVLQLFIEKALAGDEIAYFGRGARKQDFIAAEDVARAVGASVSAGKGIYNIASGQAVAMLELAELIVKIAGSKSPVGAAGKPDPQEGYSAAFDIRKAEAELGWRPQILLQDGIRRLVDSYREQR